MDIGRDCGKTGEGHGLRGKMVGTHSSLELGATRLERLEASKISKLVYREIKFLLNRS